MHILQRTCTIPSPSPVPKSPGHARARGTEGASPPGGSPGACLPSQRNLPQQTRQERLPVSCCSNRSRLPPYLPPSPASSSPLASLISSKASVVQWFSIPASHLESRGPGFEPRRLHLFACFGGFDVQNAHSIILVNRMCSFHVLRTPHARSNVLLGICLFVVY